MKVLELGSLAFCGKSILYTDFDGTYFPFTRSDIAVQNKKQFDKMYLPFDTFKKQSDGDFQVIVTTGRSKNDFIHTARKIINSGLAFCMPNKLISSNGACEFEIKEENGELAARDIFPPKDSGLNDPANEIISPSSQKYKDVTFFESKINGKAETYQDFSSESVLDTLEFDERQKYVSYAKDGRYNLEMVVSKNINFADFTEDVKKHIEENNLPYSIESYENAKYTTGVEYDNSNKRYVKANVIFLKYSNGKAQPDKFDKIKEQAREIIKNNSDDKIIVAGDGFNDEKMLNPLNYLEIVYHDHQGEIDLDNPNVIEALKRLPIRSIICGDDPALDNLRRTASILESKGVNIITSAPDSKVDYYKAVENFAKN